MLSFLYRLMRNFREEHGYQPNVVIMNTQHFRLLQENLANLADYSDIRRLLGMEVILSTECVHPHVGWLPQARRAAG